MKRSVIFGILVSVALALFVLIRPGGRLGSDPLYETGNGAIDGYDPVSYFSVGEAVKGSPDYTMSWAGGVWRFASDENRRLFEADPRKYAPQYGGYCAYGMSEGYLADVDPMAWTIVDGRLYLNFDTSVMESWRASRERRIPLADQHWAKQ